jgi:5-guanidino-2-oxopentanoate decarboxylase
MSCGGALLHQLRSFGVDTVFGIPGVHTIEFYREIESAGVRHIGVRHEQGAGFMADGYARVSGRPGVCLLITGPGVTNAATPIGEAYSDSVPLLVLSSVNATRDLGIGRGELHEITDQEAVTRPLTGFSATVLRPEQAPQLLARAFASFASQRPRPAHIQIPLDVMEMPAASGFTEARLPNAPAPDAASVEAAVGLLRKARRPVLLVGGGAVAAGEAVRALAERLDAPVVTTIAGKGIIPDSHPLSLGAGLQRAASRIYLAESDLVLVVGSELATTDLFMWGAETHKYHEALGEDHPGPGRLGYTGGLVRIDIDADTLTRDYEPDVAILGDARQTLERIGAALADDQPAGDGAEVRAAVGSIKTEIRGALTPLEAKHVAVLDALREALPDDGFVASDMTQIAYTGNTFFESRRPRGWLHPVGYGTLGYALPAAIGAKLGAPERPGAVLVGDGGLLFTVQELATAAELRMPLAIVLWNNDALGEIEDSMVRRGVPKVSVRPENPDFLALAAAFNCRAHRAVSLTDFKEALTGAFAADRPTLIEVRQDADFLP